MSHIGFCLLAVALCLIRMPGIVSGLETKSNQEENFIRFGYFASWSVYARNFHVSDISVGNFTHLAYAFAGITEETGLITVGARYGEEFCEFTAIPRQGGISLGVSVGGWGCSDHFRAIVTCTKKRAVFIASCVELLKQHKLDFIDWDWEYPEVGDVEAFLDFLVEAKAALDSINCYQVVALSACKSRLEHLPLDLISSLVSFINVMSYDFSNPSWSSVAEELAPINSVAESIAYYQERCVPSSKLVVGIPLYGVVFAECDGLGKQFNRENSLNSKLCAYDKGFVDRAALVQLLRDNEFASESDKGVSTEADFISCETAKSLSEKVSFAKKQQLGGIMFWHVGQDLKSNSLAGLRDSQ